MSADKDEIKDNNAGEAVNDRSLPSHELESGTRAGDQVGLALIEQERVIPRTADRKVTTKWEYWTYTLFCESGEKLVINVTEQRSLLRARCRDRLLRWFFATSITELAISGGDFGMGRQADEQSVVYLCSISNS